MIKRFEAKKNFTHWL